MKHVGKLAVCLAGGLVLNTGLGADNRVSPNNPYEPIVVRNIFGLNPPQPVDTTAPAPPSNITPDGIMTIFGGTPQVLFKVLVPPRPPEPASEKSYILSEGQRQDDIEVTHIDVKAGVVTFNNHGVVQEIPLVKAPPITTPTPVVMNSGFGGPGAAAGGFGGPGGVNSPRFGNNPALNRAMGNNAGTPGNPAFGNASAAGAAGEPAQPRLSPEEQMIMIAAQKAQAKQAGDPTWQIYPPTDLDQDAGTVNSTSSDTPSP
ncbi:MAG TPA: hypothetical protein VKU37_14175 [Verrucomicrobiae bacterium]|nr:hypothetical protein [Verrucomicrobiae bacterium]